MSKSRPASGASHAAEGEVVIGHRRRRTFWSVWRLRRGVEELVRDGDVSYTAASDAARAGNARGDGEYVLRSVRESS